MEGFLIGVVLLAAAFGLAMWSNKRRREEMTALHAETTREQPRRKKKKKSKSSSNPKTNTKSAAVMVDEEVMALGREAVDALDTMTARQQHYLFTHQLLREVMLGEQTALAALRKSAGAGAPYRGGGGEPGEHVNTANKAIEALWERAGKMALEMEGRREVIPGGEPIVEVIEDGVLIRMPPPTAMTEAHFIAVVSHDDATRYFTLEKSVQIDKPCLCEWTDDASHANYGDIDGTETSFLAAVRERLRD